MHMKHRRQAEAVLTIARGRPGVVIVTFDYKGGAKDFAAELRQVAKEKDVKAKVRAHPNGAVDIVVAKA